MVIIEALKETGVHDVFDAYIDESYKVSKDGELLGHICMRELSVNTFWVEHILASKRGMGFGLDILKSVFDTGVECLEGSAIFGPHLFWESVGAIFEYKVDEDDTEGVHFKLTKHDFIKSVSYRK